MPHLDNQTIQLALVVAVAAAMVLQAIVLLAALVALRKLAKSIREEMEDLRSSVMPIIDQTRELVVRIAPKIQETTTDLAALTRALRDQTADVQAATDEIVTRARLQAGRIDAMLSGVLDVIDRTGAFMADTVARPMRQVSAIIASARAVVESLRNSDSVPRAEANRAPNDSDLFV